VLAAAVFVTDLRLVPYSSRVSHALSHNCSLSDTPQLDHPCNILPTFKSGIDLAGMDRIRNDNGDQHQKGIENVEVHFVSDEAS
jgi:hypothetical protein